MLTKKKVIQSIKEMPDEFSLEDIMERLVVLQKIEIGLEQVKKGETYSMEEARNLLKKWQK